MSFMDFIKQPASNTISSPRYKQYRFKQEDLYHIERVLKKLNINTETFFHILSLSRITDRYVEFLCLETFSSLTPEKINYIAGEMHKLKTEKKKRKG
jgi:hypothetical protein